MNENPSEFAVLDLKGDEPLSFIGPPGALRGEVRISNPAAEKRHFRAGHVHLEKSAKPEGTALPTLPVSIEAGASARVELTLQLDPRTPPGVIQGEISFGGSRRPARFYVTELVALDISPEELVVEAAPGASVTRSVVFRNRGNVPLAIGGALPVTLEPEPLPGHKLARVLDSLRGEPPAKRDVKTRGATAEDAPALVARLGPAKAGTEIAPGQTVPLELTLELPRTLEEGTRYLGAAPFHAATLRLIVVARASPAPSTSRRKS